MAISKKIVFFILLFLISRSFAQTTKVISVECRTENLPFGLTKTIPKQEPEVAVVLSGGGARGLSQVGVLRALKGADIPINIITGTSMGSIVGGLYAAGYSFDQIDSIIVNTDWDALLASDRETNRSELFVDQKITEDKAIFSLRWEGFKPILPTSLNNGQKMASFLNLLTFQAPIHVDSSFDELNGKFRAVCTDLVTGRLVIIGNGSLSEAMRASSSVSFLLSPIKIDSLLLVDGGLVANIPVKASLSLGADFVIAVNTTSPLHTESELSLPWAVADQVVSIPMKLLDEYQLDSANDVIAPNLKERTNNDFSDIEAVIAEGYQSTLPRLAGIKSGIDSVFRKNLNVNEYYIKNILLDKNASDVEEPFLQKYSTRDSVSNIEILTDICSLYSEGIYKDIKVIVNFYPTYSTLKFIYEYNPVIQKVICNGITLINKYHVDSLLTPLFNKPYNAEKIVSKIIQILDLYREKGYSLAELREVSFDQDSTELSLSFDEGKISGIEIEGNSYTSSSIITREIPLKEGDYFNYRNIEQGLINLRSTNLFDDIFLNIKRNNGKNILLIQVREKPENLVRVGFRVDNEDKVQLSLDFVNENLFGSGTELGLLLFESSRERAVSLEQKAYRIFNTYLTYKVNAFYRSEDIYTYADVPSTSASTFTRDQTGEYNQTFYGGSFSVGTQVERFGNLIFEGKYQFDDVDNLQPQTVVPYNIKIVSIKASSTIDTQDRYPYPLKGFYFKGEYELAGKILGGSVGYTNFNFDYKGYFTFAGVQTLSPRVMMGFADNTLPLSEQYSLGGQSSFFGMRDNEFRGRQIFLTSLEYRYEIPFKIFFDTYFKLRYDLGSTWTEPEEIHFTDLRHGIGASLSFDTPIGPADFSTGKSFLFVKNLPKNPLSFGDTFFYFSIGYYY
ncbi:MAG: patatin-like phospholipase family protein [Ignavibacteriaceae bacterium]|jgi:NTE family protein